jgi:membrane associated rhomboid family serine protease
MIPYKDDNPTRRLPLVTIAIIIVNTIVFLMQITYPGDPRRIVYGYGAIPQFLLNFKAVQPIHPVATIFTSMFMHGGFLHLITNMLFLWIFGDNIEDRLGRMRFLIFYLLCGTAAAYGHALTEPNSLLPMIGASGAVSGILGAYVLLFPGARIHTLIFLGFFVQVIRLPALIVIGFWIIIQFINGILSKGFVGEGGVAWFAHIGGFIVGIIMIRVFLKTRIRTYA